MGRGLGRPLLRLGLTEEFSVESSSVEDVGDTGDPKEHVGGMEGGLLVAAGISSVWRSGFSFCRSDLTWKNLKNENKVRGIDDFTC